MKGAFGISIFLVQTPEDLSDPMFFLGLLSGYGFSWTHDRPSSYHRGTKSGGCPGRPSSSFSAPFDPNYALWSKGLCGLDLDLPEHPLEPLLNDWIRSIVTLRGLRVFPESKH